MVLFTLYLPRFHVCLIFFIDIDIVAIRLLNFFFKTSTFFLLVIKYGFEFEYLVFEVPELCLAGGSLGLYHGYLLLHQLLFLVAETSTSAIWLHSLTKMASLITIFSFSMRNNLGLLTTSSDITISWCYFSFALNRLSCIYFRPKVFPAFPRNEQGNSSFATSGLE